MSSKGARESASKAYVSSEKEGKARQVKMVLNIHLDLAHKAFMLLEAPTAEAVRDCLPNRGFVNFLELDFHVVTRIDELLKRAPSFPPYFPKRRPDTEADSRTPSDRARPDPGSSDSRHR